MRKKAAARLLFFTVRDGASGELSEEVRVFSAQMTGDFLF